MQLYIYLNSRKTIVDFLLQSNSWFAEKKILVKTSKILYKACQKFSPKISPFFQRENANDKVQKTSIQKMFWKLVPNSCMWHSLSKWTAPTAWNIVFILVRLHVLITCYYISWKESLKVQLPKRYTFLMPWQIW